MHMHKKVSAYRIPDSYAKLLVCCADSLFGLDVRRGDIHLACTFICVYVHAYLRHVRNRNIKHSDQRGWKLTSCWVQAQRQMRTS
jgi:hypothetical protein